MWKTLAVSGDPETGGGKQGEPMGQTPAAAKVL